MSSSFLFLNIKIYLNIAVCKESNQSLLKEISPEYSLEGLMVKLKLQYFDHLIERADSLEKIVVKRYFQKKNIIDFFYSISPGCSLEGLMVKLKLQYFGHVM